MKERPWDEPADPEGWLWLLNKLMCKVNRALDARHRFRCRAAELQTDRECNRMGRAYVAYNATHR